VPFEFRYRSRTIGEAELAFLREFITAHPELSRCALSRRICEAWQWKQMNGALREMVCRGLMLELERAGHIQLPAIRFKARNNLSERERPEPVVPDNRPVRGPLDGLLPLDIQQVRRTAREALFNSLIEQYHYLGYEQPVGEHLKYLVSSNGQAIACLAWCSAARHLASRDRFIGWSAEVRQRNLASAGLQHTVSDSALGCGAVSGIAPSGPHGKAGAAGLAAALRTSYLLAGDIRGPGSFPRHLLSRGELDCAGAYDRPRA
jgi:Domain of unknown function (DUF4338)